MDVPQYWTFASSLALLVGILNVVSFCSNQHSMYILWHCKVRVFYCHSRINVGQSNRAIQPKELPRNLHITV
jgi:hypothetical protein